MKFQRILAVGALSTAMVGAIAFGWYRLLPLPLPVMPSSSYHDRSPAFVAALRRAQAAAAHRPRNLEAVRQLALLYQANGLFAEARACYGLLPAAQLDARDHYYLADLALNTSGDLPAVATELRAALRADGGYVPARIMLAEALFKTGELDAATVEFNQVLAAHPENLQAALGLARIDIARGQSDAAMSRLEDLMANHPEATSAAAVFADLLQQRGEADRAVAMTQWSQQKPEPIPADPWSTELLLLTYDVQRLGIKAEEYGRTGQFAEAKPLLARIEQIDPASPLPALLRANEAVQRHQPAEAIREYQTSLAKGGNPETICPLVVNLLLSGGHTAEAEAFIVPFAAQRPNSVPILTARADVAVRRGDTAVARTVLAEVLRQDPRLYQQNMDLARILWSAGEFDAAARYLQQAAAAQATEVPAHALLGEYHLRRHEPADALKSLTAALKNAKAGTEAHGQLLALLSATHQQLGEAQAEQGAWPAAIEHFDAAAKLAPKDPKPLFGKANACVQAKDFRGATEALNRMAALDPSNATVFLSLGDVLYQGGDPARARLMWSRASKLVKPGDTELQSAISQRLNGAITADTFR